MVNGNSKLKLQQCKNQAHEIISDVLGESFSENFFGSGVLPFQS